MVIFVLKIAQIFDQFFTMPRKIKNKFSLDSAHSPSFIKTVAKLKGGRGGGFCISIVGEKPNVVKILPLSRL